MRAVTTAIDGERIWTKGCITGAMYFSRGEGRYVKTVTDTELYVVCQ